MSDKIALLDFSSISRPIFESTSDASQCHIKMVERVRALLSAHPHAAIACDSGRTFRHDIDASYKAQRAETPAVYLHQCALALDTLRGDGYPVWEAKGFEADDIISSAVHNVNDTSARAGVDLLERVVIISADKDLRQLVSDRVTVFAPSNGNYESRTYDVASVKEKHGVAPSQMLDYLALLGDTSDNIIGARGIGEKTAAKLLNEYGNLDDLFHAMDAGTTSIKPAGFASLMEFRMRLETVRALLTLRTDVPIPFEEIFKDRVPVDVAVFGDEDEMMSDIREALPTLAVEEAKKEDERHDESNGMGVKVAPRQPLPAVLDPVGLSPAPSVRQPEVVNGHVEWEHQLEPRTMSEAKALSDMLMASRLFSAYGHPAGILSTILAGRELGYPAMASLRAFHILDGKPAMSADFVRGLVLKSGLVDYLRCTERTPERATFAIKRKGDPEFVMSFTMDEAKAAGIVKPNSGWVRWPADMLVARCSIKICRLVVPEISHGMYEPSEVER